MQLQKRYYEIVEDKTYLTSVLREGAEAADEVTTSTCMHIRPLVRNAYITPLAQRRTNVGSALYPPSGERTFLREVPARDFGREALMLYVRV